MNKKLKITKEQYTKLVKAGLIKETSYMGEKPSNVNATFKKEFNNKPIYNFNVSEEEVQQTKFNLGKTKTVPKLNLNEVEDFIKYVYGVNEELSPYWGENNLAYEDLCEALESKGLFVKKENAYRIPKRLGSPDETKKAIHETLSEMLNHNMQEDNSPLGSDFDPNNPLNRPDTKSSIANRPSSKDYAIVYNNDEFSIMVNRKTKDAYVFNHTNIDRKAFEEYAEKHGFIDADGDMEYYDDWEINDEAIERYFNDMANTLKMGKGVNAFDNGDYDVIKIDNGLKSELLDLYDKDLRLVKILDKFVYSRNPEEEKDLNSKLLKLQLKQNKEPKDPNQLDLNLDEITGAASSGAFVTGAFLEPMKKDSVVKREIKEITMQTVGNIGYDNPGFAGISRDGDFPKNRKKTKAEQKTQWAGGSFVEFDDCTKLNNNKKAQNGGCSTGAVDNVVKQKKTSGNINAPSLNEGLMREALKLQHDKSQNKLIVLSDLEGRAASQETFHNKAVLKQNGFSWNGTNWVIDVDKLEIAKKTLSLVNKAEYIIDQLEDLEDAVENSSADNKDFLKARLDQYIMDLANATDEAVLSAEIRRYLTFFSKFHSYSFYNRMLIFIQKPDATKVGSFKMWETKHRRVKKGSKAIKVLAPIGSKKIDTDTTSDDAELDMVNQLGANRPMVTRFKAVNVFDISDTEPIDERGEVPDTPQWWGENTPSETADMLFTAVSEVAADLGIKVTQSDAKSAEKGYSAGDHINISSDVTGAGRLSTMVHEIAHELMHWKKSSIYYIDNGEGRLKNELQELQAESVSYVVLKHYGIPVAHHATYLALWKANKERIQNNIEIISKVSQFIIDKIDAHVTNG